MLEKIPISCIFPRDSGRLRRLNPEHIKRLAESIAEIGLQSPISLRAIPCKTDSPWSHNGNDYLLTAGEHRLEACRSLGWTEVPAIILDLSDVDRELWEIDENLIRAELTELERADHLEHRKILYERKYPETKHGGDRKSERRKNQVAKLAICQAAPSFVDDTAEKAGMSARDVQRSIHRAEAIDPSVKDTIRDMPEIADKGIELDALAAIEPEQQPAVVEAVRSGKAPNVRAAAKAIGAGKTRRRRKGAAGKQPVRKQPHAGEVQGASDEELLSGRLLEPLTPYEEKTGRRVAGIEIHRTGGVISVVRIIHEPEVVG